MNILQPAPFHDQYSSPLSLTSQFFFCGLPLRLDSYRGCAFQCSFCYARYRGGNSPDDSVIPADPQTLSRVFNRAFADQQPPGIIGQFLHRRVPLHFGGMSDPFQPAELRHGVSRAFLTTLAHHEYPTVISTRATLIASEPYLSLLRQLRHVVVQFSFVSTRKDISTRLEPHTPPPAQLLATMEKLAHHGIPVTCRWQPYVPRVSEEPAEFIRTVAAAGARHIALEHLKLPVESRHRLWAALMEGAGHDLLTMYRDQGARLDGREWVLPASFKLPTITAAQQAARAQGLSFGAADNDLQFLSDTSCCCSGVDQFAGFENWFQHQIGAAVRRGRKSAITYDSIAQEWSPNGSVDRWLNSRSRIGHPGTLAAHIKSRWNNTDSPFSPASYHGVTPSDDFSAAGFRIYRWDVSS